MASADDRRMASRKEKPAEKSERMDRAEMIAILEEIARDPKMYPSARVTAIRTLLEIWRADEQKPPQSGFEALDELAPRRHHRTKAKDR